MSFTWLSFWIQGGNVKLVFGSLVDPYVTVEVFIPWWLQNRALHMEVGAMAP